MGLVGDGVELLVGVLLGAGRAALDGRRALMPGNSRNVSKRVVSKKGASAGSGGKNRAGLKGRGPAGVSST